MWHRPVSSKRVLLQNLPQLLHSDLLKIYQESNLEEIRLQLFRRRRDHVAVRSISGLRLLREKLSLFKGRLKSLVRCSQEERSKS